MRISSPKQLKDLILPSIISVLILLLGWHFATPRLSLLPLQSEQVSWQTTVETDNGQSSAKIHDDRFTLSADLFVNSQQTYPFVSINLDFVDGQQARQFHDFTQFDQLTFFAQCAPQNTLSVAFSTVENDVTVVDDFTTYRAPSSYFSCTDEWRKIRIDLTRLETPQWWFDQYKLALFHQEYHLDQVARMSFITSSQSPRDITSSMQIYDVQLSGFHTSYVVIAVSAVLLMWAWYISRWLAEFNRQKLQAIQQKQQQDEVIATYQPVTINPHRLKERQAIIQYVTEQYANSELSMDVVVSHLGVNRNKINEVLKQELGHTFTSYVNTLRLTEAARIIEQSPHVSMGEVAFSVGYKNVSYFNKLFKERFGCTPKNYRNTHNQTE